MDMLTYTPQAKFSQQHLLCLQDYTPDEILQLLSLAAKLKRQRQLGLDQTHILEGKNIAMIFSKPSMRTRVSFEAGIQQLGGHALFISDAEIGLGKRESVHDVANVLSRFVDGIMIRTFKQSDVEGLAKHGHIPVINGLTDDFHPCQVLADMLTLCEHKGGLAGKKLAFVGDGNNMANSLMIVCSKLGVDVSIATPADYAPQEKYVIWARRNAVASGSKVTVTTSLEEALAGADAVYTDVWASMGMEAETEKRARDFAAYQVNSRVMALAKDDAIFMHCLPAHRGSEVTDEVMDGAQSVVFDEAENRLHAQKAVLAMLMGKQ
jgi:ornithine carbamoyltransferase